MEKRIEPIADHAAMLVCGERRTIAVADVHVGLTDELQERGVSMHPQESGMASELLSLSRYAERLVILGDLKHPLSGRVYTADIPSFMSTLLGAYEEIHIVPGNHDVFLNYSLPQRVVIHPGTGFASDGVGYLHGHAWPSTEVMESAVLLIGHMHPAYAFSDTLGRIYIEKCWLRMPFRRRDPTGRYPKLPSELMVVPAFNPLLTGTPVNRRGGMDALLLRKQVYVSKCSVYLLDGTFIGGLKRGTFFAHSEERKKS